MQWSKSTADADGSGWKGAFFQPENWMGAEISEYREFIIYAFEEQLM